MMKKFVTLRRINFFILLLSLSTISTFDISFERDFYEIRIKREIESTLAADDKSTLQSLLNKINHTLNDLSAIVSSKAETCTLSYEKLLQLKEEIDDALTNDDQSNAINCEVNVNNPDGSCAELIKMIQCGIGDMSNAINNAINNSAMLAQLQKQYNELNKKYQEFLDNNENYISQAAQVKIDELKRELQELQEFLIKVLNKLMQEIIENIANKIQQNRISEAVEKFIDALEYRLDYVYLAENIIDTAYNQGFIEKSFKFLNDLPADAYTRVGYDKLYDIMAKNNQLSTVDVFKYYELAAPSGNHAERVQKFKNKFTDEYFERVNDIGVKMCNRESYEMDKVMAAIGTSKYFIVDCVVAAYTDVKYLRSVILCSLDMDAAYNGGCMIPIAMYEAMQVNNLIDHPMTFTYAHFYDTMLEFFEEFLYPDNPNDASYKNCLSQLKTFKKNLPKTVFDSLWNANKCRITTLNGDGMMYAEDSVDNASRRTVNVVKFANTQDNRAFWKIEPFGDADNFEIINVQFNEKLAIDRHAFDGKYDKAFTRKNIGENQGRWVFHPRNNAMIIKFKNQEYGDDLVTNWSSSSSKERVNSMNAASSDENYAWKISCS